MFKMKSPGRKACTSDSGDLQHLQVTWKWDSGDSGGTDLKSYHPPWASKVLGKQNCILGEERPELVLPAPLSRAGALSEGSIPVSIPELFCCKAAGRAKIN